MSVIERCECVCGFIFLSPDHPHPCPHRNDGSKHRDVVVRYVREREQPTKRDRQAIKWAASGYAGMARAEEDGQMGGMDADEWTALANRIGGQ